MNTQTCTHDTRVIKSQQAGYSIERCTWCGQALIKLTMDSQFGLVATFTIDQLVEIVKEHAAMGEQIDKMNTEMPCGHLTRYQVQEKDTQYCSLCVLGATQVTIMNLTHDDGEVKNKCPMCETRAYLHQMQNLLDEAPEIHSALYDDAIADLSNEISNTLSLFQCMCDEVQS